MSGSEMLRNKDDVAAIMLQKQRAGRNDTAHIFLPLVILTWFAADERKAAEALAAAKAKK